MSNLLSNESLKVQRFEFSSKILLGSFIMIAISAVIGILVLLPTYILIRVDRVSIEEQLNAYSDSVSVSQNNKDRDDLIDARKRMESINKIFSRKSLATEIITSVTERLPKGIYLNSIQYFSKDSKRTINISGSIESRAQIRAYVSSLESDKLFDSVTVPVSALADADEGHFVITAEGTFEL
jgi:Tfp pilus assembly protein PilN